MENLETLHPFLTGKLQAAWADALVFELVDKIQVRFVARRPGRPDFFLNPSSIAYGPYGMPEFEHRRRAFQNARRSISCIVAAEKAAKAPAVEKEQPRADV